ncbi:MAG: MCE family protein [Candidatus Riflebacteria bacterium]|nr:MCE family protein [Candidatus Riflebacteria bacterium]
MHSTIKVGLITLIGCALLVYMMFVIGDFGLRDSGYHFNIAFYAVNGLSQGATVSMAGVKIGKVEQIEISDDQVLVHCHIKNGKHMIRRRSSFTIGTSGLMGEKFVEIIPTRDQTAPYVAPNSQVEGTDPMRMEELFEQGNELLKKLQGLTATAKDVIGDPELKQSTKNILKNAEKASERVTDIIESVRSKTDSIVNHLDSILGKVDSELELNREEIRKMIANMREFSANMANISSENRGTIKDMLANVKGVSDRLDKMIGELNREHNLTDNIKATVDSLKKASDNAKEITREVKEIVTDKDIRGKIKTGLDDAHKLAQAVDKVFLNIKQTRIDFKYLLRYNKDNDSFFSDMMVDIYPNESSFYRLGVEDIGGDPLFNLMLARDAQSKLIKRGGVISSKVGLGIDYMWAEDISYSLDFIDTRDPKIRFTSSYLVKSGLKLQLRVDDITRTKAINFGVEYKF